MWRRVLILLRARLSAGPREGLPVAALLSQAMIAAFLCGLVRGGLPPFAYGLFALTLTGALVAIPLLGELGWLLRRDEAREWVAALPVGRVERRLARTLHLLVLLFGLALGSLVPAALLAPESTELAARLTFPLAGLGMVTLLAALLLLVQSLFGERAEGLLVLFQTLLVVGVVVGLALAVRAVPLLARLPSPGDEHAAFLWALPPTWFAAPLATAEGEPARAWIPLLASAVALLILLVLPSPARPRGRRTPWLARLLAPVRALATRFWVRRSERGAFDLVFDALPLEREVVLRTVPMLGIPLAFLVIAATGEESGGGARGDVLALLLFTAGVYLPILLTHVPATATPDAAWITRMAPVSAPALVGGTIKALAVRFLVPLYVLLILVSWAQGGGELVLRLALPGFLASLLVLRRLYPVCVSDLPLSTAPDRIRFDLDWLGVLGGLALGLTVLAVLAQRFLETIPAALGLVVVLAGFELLEERRLARGSGPGSGLRG